MSGLLRSMNSRTRAGVAANVPRPVGHDHSIGAHRRLALGLGERQRRCLQVGNIQDRDVFIGVVNHHSGGVVLTVNRDADAPAARDDVCVRHHPIRCNRKAAALQYLLASSRHPTDLHDTVGSLSHDPVARQRGIGRVGLDDRCAIQRLADVGATRDRLRVGLDDLAAVGHRARGTTMTAINDATDRIRLSARR